MPLGHVTGRDGQGDRRILESIGSALEGVITMVVIATLTVTWVAFWGVTIRNHLRLGHSTEAVTTGIVMVLPALVLLHTFLKTLLDLIGYPSVANRLPGSV